MDENEQLTNENQKEKFKRSIKENSSEIPIMFTNKQKNKLNLNTDIQVESEIPISIKILSFFTKLITQNSFKRFTIVNEIGRGSYGKVLKYFDSKLNKQVALKVFKSKN